MPARTTGQVGSLLRARRIALGFDQRALAAKVGVNRQWVIDLEKGKPGAALGLVLRACSALNLRVEILPREAAPESAVPRLPPIDLDWVIARARKKKP